MIECPCCGRKHRPGTLFCKECGVYLATGGLLGTEPILQRGVSAAGRLGWNAASNRGANVEGDAVLRVNVLSTGRQVQLPAGEEVHVGRMDAAHGILPDIDLTPDGGLEGGVSRRHCKIYEKRGQYFVEDLDSANGTFLNDEQLTPYVPHSLSDGDQLRLGQMALSVTIQR